MVFCVQTGNDTTVALDACGLLLLQQLGTVL